MSKSKNNFKDANVLEKVQYHCWVLYCNSARWNGVPLPRKKRYNGFLTKRDKGLQSLKDLVYKRSPVIEQARLYQTRADKQLYEWNSKNKCWE